MSTMSYLIVQDYHVDPQTKYGSMGHLLAFNPTKRDAKLDVTFYYEDEGPTKTSLLASALKTSEWNWNSWEELRKYKRFAMGIASEEPVFVQATIGWNNTMNDYSPRTKNGERECAKSYLGITSLSKVCYYVDSVVIDTPRMWVRESEWNILLNPTKRPAEVAMTLYFRDGTVQELKYTVPAERLKWVYMDEVVDKRNQFYGTKVQSSEPIAAHHLRVVYWMDKDETAYWTNTPIMTFWTVPFLSAPLS